MIAFEDSPVNRPHNDKRRSRAGPAPHGASRHVCSHSIGRTRGRASCRARPPQACGRLPLDRRRSSRRRPMSMISRRTSRPIDASGAIMESQHAGQSPHSFDIRCLGQPGPPPSSVFRPEKVREDGDQTSSTSGQKRRDTARWLRVSCRRCMWWCRLAVAVPRLSLPSAPNTLHVSRIALPPHLRLGPDDVHRLGLVSFTVYTLTLHLLCARIPVCASLLALSAPLSTPLLCLPLIRTTITTISAAISRPTIHIHTVQAHISINQCS